MIDEQSDFFQKVAAYPPAAMCAVHFNALSCVGLFAKLRFVAEQCRCPPQARGRKKRLRKEFDALQVVLPDLAKEENVTRFIEAHRADFTVALPPQLLRRPNPQITLVLTLLALEEMSAMGLKLLSRSHACNAAFCGQSLVRLDTVHASSWHTACLRYAAQVWIRSRGERLIPIPPLENCQLQSLAARLEVEYVRQKDKAQPNGDNVPSRDPCIKLVAPGQPVRLKDREMPSLTLAQYDVIKALLDAGERGLSKDELDHKSNRGDARKILKRLANSDPDWNRVIHFPGKTGGGYRIG